MVEENGQLVDVQSSSTLHKAVHKQPQVLKQKLWLYDYVKDEYWS